MTLTRRGTLKLGAGAALLPAFSIARAQTGPHVVVVGGGFAGATAAKYLRIFNPSIRVTLIEPNTEFTMCPMSNRVLAGGLRVADLVHGYGTLVSRYGIRILRATADAIDPAKREVLAGGQRIAYDWLIVAPGIELVYAQIQGMEAPGVELQIPHAYKAGAQTQLLRDQLVALRPGGTVAMHIPKMPYRCPPGPYERASLIAYHLRENNPRAKLFVFDSNHEIQSKKGLFESVWKREYRGLIEYVHDAEIEKVDVASKTMTFKVQGPQRADVVNIIPPQRANTIARASGLANVGQRWCGVNFISYESTAHPRVHVIGDSIAAAPGTPRSAHMANQQAKVCASAIAAMADGQPPPAHPIIANTCYSFVSHTDVVHVAAVYRYDAAKKTLVAAPGSGGLSPEPSRAESVYAMAWGSNIIADVLS